MDEPKKRGRPKKAELQPDDLSDWVKADGKSKITLNNEPATIEYADSQGWKRA